MHNRKNTDRVVIICNQTSWNLVKKVMFPLQRQLNSCRFVFLCNNGELSHMVLVLHGWKSFSDTSGPAKRQLVVRFHSKCYSQSGVRVLAKKKKISLNLFKSLLQNIFSHFIAIFYKSNTKILGGLCPSILTRALAWNCWWVHSPSRFLAAFYNHLLW